jgi:hypothetical protein
VLRPAQLWKIPADREPFARQDQENGLSKTQAAPAEERR